MNLFIGLLNMAIEKDNDRASYLVQKAEVIAEIELFYLLPHQRRWKTWFPEVIYYTVEVEKARKYIREAIIKASSHFTLIDLTKLFITIFETTCSLTTSIPNFVDFFFFTFFLTSFQANVASGHFFFEEPYIGCCVGKGSTVCRFASGSKTELKSYMIKL
ncbi:hypothetical protein GLOIN_2v1781805 [Rhizophagus irregularis DAOM 181602=DAOM 197198]|nr:hypothetical protein GLOIN_2v1781805 [Rhizophagus irregularis DAOM 181602=DAOM 197198]